MKRPTKSEQLVYKFYLDKDTGIPDIRNYGKYRLGLTSDEVKDYILVRAIQKGYKLKASNKKLFDKYYKIAGVNTCAVVDDIVLAYRHDVLRFAEVMFNNVETYWD
jgi:hypothetical protein